MVILPHFFLLFYPFEVDCHQSLDQSVVVLKPRNIQRDEGRILWGKLLFFSAVPSHSVRLGFKTLFLFWDPNNATCEES